MTDNDLVPVEERALARTLVRPDFDTRSTFEILPYVAQLADAIAKTNVVPKAYRGNPAEITACVLVGHELGLMPMTALNGIDMIDGRSSISARLMRALVLAAGHTIYFSESSTVRVTIVGQRAGSTDSAKVTWTKEDVETAGLASKDVHRKYPRQMLKARATGELCRDMFADVLSGLGYTTEEVRDGWAELEAPPDEPDGTEGAPRTATTAKRTAGRKRAPAKTSAQPKKDTPAPPPAPPLPGEDDVVDVVEGPDGVHAAAGDEPEPVPPGTGDEDSPPTSPEGEPSSSRSAAQRIAIAANKAGVDRAEVIFAVTGGRKTSGKELADEEVPLVLEALRRIRTGELALEENSAGEPELIETPTAEPDDEVEPDEGDASAVGAEADWGQDDWTSWLREHKIRMVPVLKYAKNVAADIRKEDPGCPIPDKLGDMKGHASLAALVRAHVEEQIGDAP